ncbi:helix-turn-helix domain-containing protein [Paenibacillus cellulosilyticus]|nr:helix-turn-helix domain-containing protein [Paenibacillus cellulosilyticus]
MEQYALIPYRSSDHQLIGTFIIGPSLLEEVPDLVLQGMRHDQGMSAREAESLAKAYKQMPIYSRTQLLHLASLCHYMIYGEQLPITSIYQHHLAPSNGTTRRNAEVTLSTNRENNFLHHDSNMEKQLFQCIKKGRKEEFIQMMKVLPLKGQGTLSRHSQLRNSKNIAITAIALSTRAAMDGGLHSEIAYTISDLYIQQIEDLHRISDVNAKMFEAMIEFIDRVRAVREQSYSRVIVSCQNYIFDHLYEDIPLDTLAKLVELNPSYLSRLFKKETGMTISAFILLQKVEEAKSLLSLTKLPLSDICARLNFFDQSHFTKSFSKITGETPMRFRAKHGQ